MGMWRVGPNCVAEQQQQRALKAPTAFLLALLPLGPYQHPFATWIFVNKAGFSSIIPPSQELFWANIFYYFLEISAEASSLITSENFTGRYYILLNKKCFEVQIHGDSEKTIFLQFTFHSLLCFMYFSLSFSKKTPKATLSWYDLISFLPCLINELNLMQR